MNHHTLSSVSEKVAASLLETQAVILQPNAPFTWASGWKSPIYCDNRLVLSYPKVRKFIAQSLAEVVRSQFNMIEAIAGVATAGIPWAALVAAELDLPMLYIRSAAKGHGKENLIEGRIEAEQRVVIIEDLISTGGSSLKAAQAVKDAGMEPLGMVAVFTYGFPVAAHNFQEAGLPLHTLSNYETLIQVASNHGILEPEQLETLATWRNAPEKWNA